MNFQKGEKASGFGGLGFYRVVETWTLSPRCLYTLSGWMEVINTNDLGWVSELT